MADQPEQRNRTPGSRLPSLRLTAALAAAMLAIGAAVGAAIGPAPSPSFAGSTPLPLLIGSLTAQPPAPLAGSAAPAREAKASAPVALSSATAAPAAPAPEAQTPSPAPAATPEAASPTAGTAPATGQAEGPPKSPLAPVGDVWLIELSDATFASALASPSAAPYITGQAVPAGTLLTSWSALSADAFAAEVALSGGVTPQLVNTIVQPPCPEGTPPVPCAPGTPGALTAADEFLKETVPTITGTPAYREHGMIVITFASITAGAAAGLPAGSTAAAFTATPPAGALLLSPFAAAGTRSAVTYEPTSPRTSIDRLLRR
jgi:hypothetical protein